MHDLRELRKDSDSSQWEETRILQATTVQESLHQWLVLQQSFEWQLQETAAIFEGERRQALAELQSRLLRLTD